MCEDASALSLSLSLSLSLKAQQHMCEDASVQARTTHVYRREWSSATRHRCKRSSCFQCLFSIFSFRFDSYSFAELTKKRGEEGIICCAGFTTFIFAYGKA